MKHIKILLFSLAFLAMLCVVGCTNSSKSDDSQLQSTGSAISATEKVLISVDYATDELLSEYDSFINEYVELEYSEKIMLRTNIAARDFRFIEVGSKEEGENIEYFESTVLYSTDELLPKEPLVVGISFPGILPTRGITFVDENNTTRYFYIVMSGENGALSLVEFT